METTSIWFDRDGKPIDGPVLDMGAGDPHAHRDRVSVYLLSTEYQALDHSFGRGAPLVHETMVFADGPDDPQGWDEWQDRYPTAESAAAGHRAVVATISEGGTPADYERLRDAG